LPWGTLLFLCPPKVLKDGAVTDVSLGYQYTSNSAGNVRSRFSNTAKNEPFDETVSDSINAIEDSTFGVFLTPFEYARLNRPSVQVKIGGGLYYEYHTIAEKASLIRPFWRA
jgi:hypothetical protein